MILAQPRGLLDSKNSWFVPWAELSDLDNIEKPDYGSLRKVDSEILETDQFIEDGSAFTISLESFFVAKAHDSNNKNDLLVRSFIRYGNEPKVETIHFFATNIAAATFQSDLEYEHVFARQVFSKEARVWLALEILEIDQGLDQDGGLSHALSAMRGKFGAIFPALTPFASIAGVAIGMIGKLEALQKAAAKNEPIFNNQLDFYARAASAGDAPLRCGAYILFNEAVQGVQYRLGSGFQLKRKALKDKDIPILHDYAVVKIAPGIVESGQDTDNLLKNQQIATVVSELDGRKDSSDTNDAERRALHFSFLANLVDNANQFKDLEDYRRLQIKRKVKGALSTDEENRQIDIVNRLGNLISD